MTDPRVAFEAATQDTRCLLRKYEGQSDSPYAYESVEFAWQMWQAAIKHEREECAKVCTDLWHTLCDRDADIGELSVAGDCAYLIRTRGAPPPPVEGQGLDG